MNKQEKCASSNKEQLISVIVPVYNSEQYLDRCINSLLQQTYENIEFIFVDDGSTDNSKYIIKKYSAIDKRVKYVCQVNQGVSKARNRGIDISRGQYLLFVDSDDYIASEMIEKMYNQYIQKKCDLVFCGFIYDSVYRRKIQIRKSEKVYFKYFDSNLIKELYDSKIMFAIGTKLYRKDIVAKYDIRFKKQNYLEDVNFCLNYMKKCDSIYICKQAFYCYDVSVGDSLNKKNQKKNQLELILQHMDELHSCFDSISQVTNDFYSIYTYRILEALKDIYEKNQYSLLKVWNNITRVIEHIEKYSPNMEVPLVLSKKGKKIWEKMLEGKRVDLLFLLLSWTS